MPRFDAAEKVAFEFGLRSSAQDAGANAGDIATTDADGELAWEAPAGGAGILQQATIELTDAQIKVLPTTPVELVEAQGADKIILPVYANLVADFRNGAYTNIGSSFTELFLSYQLGNFALILTTDDATGSFFTTLLTTTNIVRIGFVIQAANYREDWGQVISENRLTPDDANKALSIEVSSDAGNLTGGHTANTLRVSVAYLVLNLATGVFV